ncbi:MAG: helix-turn-helix domain-containing protein [Legionellales bacterium]|nr:helix-turn-helix domain-containing protein [Legionellales bacterium]
MRRIHSPKELALMVVEKRKKLKLSQSMVAKQVGLKQQTVSAFENKPESTKLETLFQILSAVEMDITLLSKTEVIAEDKQWREEW